MQKYRSMSTNSKAINGTGFPLPRCPSSNSNASSSSLDLWSQIIAVESPQPQRIDVVYRRRHPRNPHNPTNSYLPLLHSVSMFFFIFIFYFCFFIFGSFFQKPFRSSPTASYSAEFGSQQANQLESFAFHQVCILFFSCSPILDRCFVVFFTKVFYRGRTSIAVGACMVYQPQLKKDKRKGKPALPKVCLCHHTMLLHVLYSAHSGTYQNQ